MNKTGNMIAELRKEAGYTQKTLADVLCVTDKAVSKWERGICLPDVSLLPKLSLLLDSDIEMLLSPKPNLESDKWVGVLDLSAYDIDISLLVYDKPLVYYLLFHFLLVDVTDIYIRTTETNIQYLKDSRFQTLGFRFHFGLEGLEQYNIMAMNRPLFLFGSDLSRHFRGAMVSDSIMKLVPANLPLVFLFCPREYAFMYRKIRST